MIQIKWIGSPNYDTNRKSIDTIFIHWIVGTLAAADTVFAKSDGTSAHYGVEDDKVHQYVKEEHVAYHAGVYSWNQRSIGIEHSADPNRPASEATYQTAGKLIGEIAKRHNIPLDRTHIKGHKEVKATQCPGTMDIDKLIRIAKESDLPTPNPGYAPTHEGQTVEKDGIIYESYKKDNVLLWNTRPSTPPPAQITEDTIIPQIENRSVRDIKKELLDARAFINVLGTKINRARKELE